MYFFNSRHKFKQIARIECECTNCWHEPVISLVTSKPQTCGLPRCPNCKMNKLRRRTDVYASQPHRTGTAPKMETVAALEAPNAGNYEPPWYWEQE